MNMNMFSFRYVILSVVCVAVTQSRPTQEQSRESVLEILDRLDKALDSLIQESAAAKNNVQRNEDGPVPYRRDQDGYLSHNPDTRNEDGPIPYGQRSLDTEDSDSVSLHDVMEYLQNMRHARAGREQIHSTRKRDYDIPFPFH